MFWSFVVVVVVVFLPSLWASSPKTKPAKFDVVVLLEIKGI